MIGINRVTLLGRMAADPEPRQTKSGKSMVRLAVAIPGMRNGESTVDYFEVVAWNATAEACAKFLTKGAPIYVEGRMSKRVWDAPDGQKRSKYSVAAQRVVFLGSKPGAPGGQEALTDVETQSEELEEPVERG
jgi:single-strand DNA-binding protein